MTPRSDAAVASFIRGFILDMLPIVSVLVLAMLTTIPMGFPGTIRMGGLFPLIGIAYWTLVRPKNILPFMTFFIGLFADIMTFSPLGLHAFIFVLSQSVWKRQRRFLIGQGFWVMWAAFALIVGGFFVMLNGFQFALTQAVVPLRDTAISAAIAWACVPLVLWVLGWLHDLIDLFDEPIA